MPQLHKWKHANQEFPSNINPSDRLPDGVQGWPVEKAFIPIADIWRATGVGTVGIIRRGPNGNCWTCFTPIQMNMGGIQSFSADADKPLQNVLDFFDNAISAAHLPPAEEGTAELAARYLWGAYAWGLEQGDTWPPGTRKKFLNLFPTLAGSKDDWLRQFIKADPLVPANFLNALRRFRGPDDLPEGKEVVVTTLMLMDLPNPANALAALRSKPGDFQELAAEGATSVFHWIKERRAAPGKKVAHGAIRIDAAEMLLEGPTLSAAAELAMRVRETVGREPRLKKARWLDATHLTFSPPGMIKI